uniref:Histone-lysine N-methyltransferase 2C n=1 Tax=Lates calcarifer TaxID=8187 RepID=A0A4W6DHQ7_LATCA
MDGTEITESIGPQDTETQIQPVETAEVATSEVPEEDKPSSPLAQSPPAENSAGPSVPASREVKSSERLCAFCYCGGRSLLGQGDLRVFSTTPQFEALFSHMGGGGSTSDSSDGDKTTQPKMAGETTSGQREKATGSESCEEETDPASRFWDELSHVGLPQDLKVQSVFESGQCWAHQSCALWSEGVCEGEGQSLLNVDRAIDSGSTKHCAYCKRLGASIKCCAEGCAQLYHYPCAGAAGTFQDIRSLSLLCPEHSELAIHKYDVNCALCDSPGDLQDQLFCTSCGQHYHGMCLDMAVTPLRRAGWQCPECKVCQTCKNPGEDTKMLVCDMCDKGYHTFCLQPAIDSLPTNGWRCKNCRMCIQCGTRTSGQWHHTSLLCENCVQNQDPALCCPTCTCILDPEHHKDLLFCHTCKRWLHLECERQNSGQAEIHPREDYVCSNCRSPAAEQALQAEDMDTGPELSPQPASMHTDSETSLQLAQKHTDLEPGTQLPHEMHNDPKPELLAVPLHSDPEPVQATVQEEKLATSEMDTTPESKPNLSFPSLSSEEKPLKTSVERLAEMVSSPSHSSPLLRGTSPREPQQTQILPSLGEHSSVIPTTTTLIPLTPKIGMGKPAITKRKFSPGRPRVKQGSLSGLTFFFFFFPLPPSCSQQGRGSGFPGRRRPRGAGLSGRAGRGRARGKNGVSPSINPGVCAVIKEEEENAMHNTVVIFSSNDSFTLKQDMCVVCGSFGLGAEGRLLACAQCGQCYHPFCVGIKITKVVLSKGWRCLECTVCEACGQATDPGRLLLCDDCDISYHTYCLDPPLQNVPKDSWKCKWCVSCTQCGATTPGLRCDWQNNYTQCAPCASVPTCPICLVDYSEGTIVVQCRQCDRWFHASCQGLHSEEDVEKAADSSFDCTMCRARDAIEPVVMTQVVTKAKEIDLSRTYTQDGVCLTESGLCQLQSLSATASRRRKPKPKLKLKIINQNSVAVLQAPMDPLSEHSRDEDMEDNREAELIDCEGKSDSSLEREPAEDDSKGADGGKKRKRKPYRPGIGGFMVRQRSRPGQGPGKAKRSLCRKDSSGSVSENPVGKDEGWTEPLPDTPVDEAPPGPEVPEKIKKRYRKKKTKLEEAFPTYLQEAFFGKDLLDKSKQSRQQGVESGLLEEGQGQVERKHPTTSFLDPSSDPLLSASATSLPTRPTAEPLVDLSDVLNTDADILGMLGKPTGLDIGPLADSSPMAPQSQAGRRTPRTLPEEPLDGILSPELDKMVTDESILSKLYKIPELEGKDVEDLFTAVLSPSMSQPPPPPQVPHPQGPGPLPATPGTSMPHPNPGTSLITLSDIQHLTLEAVGPWPSPAHGPGPTPPGSLPEGETEAMSNAQRSTLKWEKEETLGELATVAPVLYTNVNFPNLKEEYPDWSTRVKQIAKLWRKASSQDRAPYVQKARDNRAALRINKVQMSNETVKRHHPQQQPPEVFDPNIPLDTELLFKDPLKPKESEHEQEWKFRQQMRQKSKQQAKIEATQKLEQVKNEQLQQQQQQQQQQTNSQSEGDGNTSGNQSPASQPSNGSMSPMQQLNSKDTFARPQLPGTPTSGPPEDVFLRPPPPPPSGPSSQPQSPQVFSPGSSGSRPSSPWDPYAKMVGTPRPPTLGPNSCRRMAVESGKSPTSLMEQQDRGRPSPAHESFGSPTSMSSDPYAKPPDTPRPTGDMDPFLKPMGPPRASQAAQGRPPMGSPGRDPYSRPMIRNEAYQRMAQNRMILSDPYSRPLLTPIPGSNESGSVPLFKTPMPPPQAQDPFSRPGQHPPDRFSQNQQNDPYAQPPHTPRPSGNDSFTSPPRIGQHHSQGHSFAQPGPMTQMSRNPYAHAPSTPRPDHFTYDPFAQPSVNQRSMNDPGAQPRPFFEPYARPPGTPRPHDNYDPYSQAPATPRPSGMNQFAHQSHPGQRMSPSHSVDPYAQPPGTPRPMLNDPYAQPPGTPRPGPDGLNRQGPRPGPMASQDPFPPPQGRLQEPFPHPGSQTPKHPSVSEDGFTQSPSRRPSQTPVHDPFEQAPMTPRPQSEKMEMKDQSGVGNNGAVPQDPGQLSNNPQMPGVSADAQGVALAESEERLRQRQRIRELILKQQQQRSAIRQERGPQEPAGNITPGMPRPWPQEGPGQQGEMFNRPPPPYPGQGPMRGPMRFPGPFPGDQRVSFPNEGQIPRGPHPGDPHLRHQGPRFAFPPGPLGPHGPQEFFPRGQHPMQDVPPQMRRSMSAEMAKSMGGNPMGMPQHFQPRGMPLQHTHNIMGQPFIELRHRVADNRPRMPFPPGAMQGSNIDPNLQVQRPAGFPDARFPLNQGPRMVDPMTSQTGHIQLSASMDNLHQQAQMSGNNTLKQSPLMRSMSQPASNETQSMAASMILTAPPAGQTEAVSVSNSEAVEEKLDAEESAVKDLEDVEVKDLVDADLENLNLDPEDGKDLDLETNDLHLDDFLTSGKFDIIAYTDPDLDDIKKDMFNEELDLSDPMDDNADTTDINKNSSTETEASSSSASALAKSEASGEQSTAEVKLEAPGNQDSASLASGHQIKTEVRDCQKAPEVVDQQAAGNTLTSNQQGVLSDSTPVLSSLLIKQQPEEQSLNPIVESVSQGGNLMPQQNQVTDTQHSSGLTMSQTISDATTAGEASMTGFGADHQVGLTPGVDQSGLTQTQQTALNQAMGQQQRPLLLEEQPLLLQDLLDQERQEQQQQRQMQAMIRQRSSDSFFPNIDFDSITDPIMKAKMVALKGINKVMVQNNMGMAPMVMNRFPSPVPPCPESTPLPPQVVGQDGKLTQVTRPNPPNFGPGFVNNAQRAQYEEWLQETQQLLQMQQKFLEEKIGAHRKSKKALSAKQRTAKKAGREFPEEDAEQLKHVTEQQGVVQKQLEQIRKQQKEHAELIEEYRVKHQQNNMTPIMPGIHPMPGPAGMVPSGPPMVQPPINPMMQMPLHPSQTNAPPRMPNPPPGWHPGMPMGNIPPHSQMPVEPQAPPVPPGSVKPMQPGGVKFDDNNPFSEGFQERERRERLREQQERQRVQLMQEVERQRALKHRMEMEQQGMMGPDGNMAPLAQMPFFNAELPQDFMQPQRPPLQQQPLGPVFPQQQGMQPGMGSPPGTFMQGDRRAMMGNGMMPPDMGPGMGPGMGPDNLALQAPNFPQGQQRPRQFSGPGMMLQMPGEGPPFDSATPLPSNFPGSGQSLIQLYSNIIPDEKGKKKRTRKKKKDDDADSVKTPSTPHSDLTAPLTPCVSDTSSTPTRNPHLFGDQDLSRSPLLGSSTPSHSELERQLSGGQSGQPGHSSDTARTQAQEHDRILNNIKLEQTDASECHGPREGPVGSEMSSVKEEGSKGSTSPLPTGQSPNKGEAGNELLKHLLKNKSTPPPGLPQQRSEESLRSEEEEPADCKTLLRQTSSSHLQAYSDGTPDFPGPLLPEQEKKKGRNKRAPKGGEKPASRYKKRKKEGDERQLMHSTSDTVMTQIKQQSNLSNPPTPPASLPPTPPPVNRQKMINGFATTEELASKAAAMVSKGLVPKPLHVPFRTEEDLLARAIAQGPKTVDVPASLPTPPHNNQEELRGQEPCKDRDTPDSFVPSSSPESVAGMEISRYPDLSLVKEEPPSPCLSPVLPMLPAPDGKGSEIKLQDIKTEPSAMFFGSPFGPASNDSKQRLVSVAITLRPAAAENITGVVAAISDLLCVKIPSSYEVSSTPDRGSLSVLSGPRVGPHGMEPRPPMLFHGQGDNGGLHGRPGQMMKPSGPQGMMQQQHTPASPGGKPQWCCNCKVVVLGNGVQKSVKDLPAHMKDSMSLLPASAQTESLSKAQHQYSNNMSSLDVHCLAQLQPKLSPPSTPPIPFPTAGETPKMENKSDAIKVTVKLKARPRSHDGWHQGKRQKGLRWRKWTIQVVVPRGNSQLPDEDKIDELLNKLGASLRPPALLRDQRRCCFCHQFGDGITDGPARLLNLDLDVWVHLNCALWSTEVYETQAGALINVELALRRGQTVRCAYCQQTGATSGCHRLRCTNVYHFTCALQAQCTFFKDKTMLCHAHRPRGTAGQALEHELRCFAVFRRVYVQRDEVRQIATAVQQPELGYTFRVGSLVLHAMGQLTPLQMAAFHSPTAIFPVGYEACRIYWSMRHGNRRCRYVCSVEDKEGLPEFTIRVIEQGYQDLVLTDNSPKGVWDKVLGPVAEKRTESGTLKLFPVYLKGEDLFGLTVPAVTKITESLPGVEACDRYSFRYGRNPLVELPLMFNPAGSARAQPRTSSSYTSLVIRPQPQTVSTSNARSNQNVAQGEGGAPHSKPPVVHPRSSQYRWMKSEWRANVYLARSRIQGLGLFAARDIEKQTMVIEYNGTILRNEVAIRKEKIYRSQNRAVFMFRIDSEHVVDATRTGGLARYINHSCAPNCVAEVVTFERGYKIIISCIRRIEKGEELCFDYQFDTVEDQHKIACHCGAPECRKWIN